MKHLGPMAVLTMAACVLPGAAQAQGQVAITAKSVHVRAGPARDYPVVALVPGGYQVLVQGCLPDYSWCDVLAGPNRGWVFARNINYAYQNTYVPVATYGAVIGIGVLAFVLDDYWGRHYHNRSWYGERYRWRDRPAPRYYGPGPVPRYGPGPVPRRYDAPPAAPRFNGPPPAPHYNGPGPGQRRGEPQPAPRLDGNTPRPGGFAPRPPQPVQPRAAVPEAPRRDNSGAGTPWISSPDRQP